MSAVLAQIAWPPDVRWNASMAEWLAGLFVAPPSADAIVQYRGRMGTAFFAALTEETGCAAGVQQMQSALAAENSPVAVARNLSMTFTRMFDAGGSGAVALYESAHVTASGRLFQAPAGEMEKLLRLMDVSIDAAFREPADHLSIELALLARLMRDDTDHQTQAALLDDHLLIWVSSFADQCRDHDRTGFYAGAARVLRGFLITQRAMLPVEEITKLKAGAMSCR